MKAIILISSIFYILGLKVSNKIDVIRKSNPVEKIITNTIKQNVPSGTFFFNDNTAKDTLAGNSDNKNISATEE